MYVSQDISQGSIDLRLAWEIGKTKEWCELVVAYMHVNKQSSL
jgi:hypothetical protein